MQRYRRYTRLAALILLFMATLLMLPSTLFAQDDSQVTWQVYDVTVQVNDDGSLRITEEIVIDFNGSFGRGKRSIPMIRMDAIEDVEVAVGTGDDPGSVTSATEDRTFGDSPGTFRTSRSDGNFVIDYAFDRTASDGSDNIRSVVISYTVQGATRDYPEAEPAEQQVRWTAISSDVTVTGPVESASATIIFPDDIPEDRLAIDPNPTSVEADRVVWQREDLGDGDSLQVAVAFPPATAATAPAWQAEADKYEGRQEMLPGIHLLLGMIAFVVSVVTILTMVVRGVRDPEVGLIADIIPERPDELPAPLVGALIDESVDTKDVIAGLLDLEHRGIITIAEGEKKKGTQTYTLRLNVPLAGAPEWHRPMLEGLFSGGADVGTDVDLADRMKTMRQTAFSVITSAYEKELFNRGYFAELPHKTRSRWVSRLLLIFAAFGLAVGVAWWWSDKFSGWAAMPLVIAGLGLIVGLILTTKAAVKTTDGAVEAAKWKAFGRYIQQLKKGPEPGLFLEVIARDLPWAVALGFDSTWSNLATDMPASTATTRDARSRHRGMTPVFVGGMGGSSSGDVAGSGGDRSGGGGLQGASASTLAAIGGGSAGLFSMLNSAAAGFNAGASSGSGGSGGSSGSFSGSSSVGSSGGGGHSFS